MELHIVFDGPPGDTPGRFVEVEDQNGKGVKAGEWCERPDGCWELVIGLADFEIEHRHIIKLTEEGWTIQHPLTCRPNLFDCPFNEAMNLGNIADVPEDEGLFYCEMAEDGFIEVKEAVD